jgi:hypothetical protein
MFKKEQRVGTEGFALTPRWSTSRSFEPHPQGWRLPRRRFGCRKGWKGPPNTPQTPTRTGEVSWGGVVGREKIEVVKKTAEGSQREGSHLLQGGQRRVHSNSIARLAAPTLLIQLSRRLEGSPAHVTHSNVDDRSQSE